MYRQRIAGLAGNFEARVEALVHESAHGDALLEERHRTLIASHLSGGLLAVLAFGGYFAIVGTPWQALAALAWFLSPVAIALYLSRTGNLDGAHFLSAANLAGIVCLAAGMSGGSASFAVVWLVIVPLEAALSANRNVLVGAAGVAILALLGLHVATLGGFIPAAGALPLPASELAFIGNLAAAGYACTLAASTQRLHRSTTAEIEAGRERYRIVAENASDLITRHAADGRVLFSTSAASRILGVAPGRIVADGLEPCLAEADRARFRSAIRRAANGATVSEEFAVTRPFGRADSVGANDPLWLEMRCQPSEPAADGERSVVVVTRDITTRKEHETTLARARDAAEASSRAKTHFIATMSHELRTPLNSIIGFSELLHRELLLRAREPKHARYCSMIHESGEHLLGVVNDLLDVSKIEAGHFKIIAEPFEIDAVARSAVETLRPAAAAKDIDLGLEIAGELPDVTADRRSVKQILMNLVANACKFTPEKGRVRVVVRQIGECVEMSVADTGIGMSPEALGNMGSPFFQADHSYARQHEGTGLGISIVKGLVELHGGGMTVESAPGEGTTVTVLLPMDCEAAARDAASGAGRGAGSKPSGLKPSVLKVVPRRPMVRVAELAGGPPEHVEIVAAPAKPEAKPQLAAGTLDLPRIAARVA